MQVSLFFTKNYRGFVCVNCVKIPVELKEKFNNHEKSIYKNLKREVNACENITMVQKENESKLINGIKKLNAKHKKESREHDLVELIEKVN